MPEALKRRRMWIICVVALITALFSPFIGIELLSPAVLLGPRDSLDFAILTELRIPRVLAAFMTGSALALAGMAYQAIFLNVLASPFTLGVSSGAAFGAAAAIVSGLSFSFLGFDGATAMAFAGALLITALLMLISSRIPDISRSNATLLLAGVVISFFFSSLILLLQYLSDYALLARTTRWLMGSIDNAPGEKLALLAAVLCAGTIVLYCSARDLDLLTLGPEIAASRGAPVHRVRRTVLVAASLLVATVVALFGPIGFVGIMVPHAARTLVGTLHRALVPAVLMIGGALLTLCDLFARTIIPPFEIPVGVVTALLGGPFFLLLLFKRD